MPSQPEQSRRRQAAIKRFAALEAFCPFSEDAKKVIASFLDYYAQGYGAQDPTQLLAILSTDDCLARKLVQQVASPRMIPIEVLLAQLEDRCRRDPPMDIEEAKPFGALSFYRSRAGGPPITSLDMLQDLMCSYQEFRPNMMASLFFDRNGVPAYMLFLTLRDRSPPPWQPDTPTHHLRNEQGSAAEPAYAAYITNVFDTEAMRKLYALASLQGLIIERQGSSAHIFQDILDKLSNMARQALTPMDMRGDELLEELFDRSFAKAKSAFVGMDYDESWNANVCPTGDGNYLVLFYYGYWYATAELCLLFSEVLLSNCRSECTNLYDQAARHVAWIAGLGSKQPVASVEHLAKRNPVCGIPARCLFNSVSLFILCHELGHIFLSHLEASYEDLDAKRQGEISADAFATATYARAQAFLTQSLVPNQTERAEVLASLIRYGPHWLLKLIHLISLYNHESQSTHPPGDLRAMVSDAEFRAAFGDKDSPVKTEWSLCEEFWREVKSHLSVQYNL